MDPPVRREENRTINFYSQDFFIMFITNFILFFTYFMYMFKIYLELGEYLMLKLILPEEKYWESFLDALDEQQMFPTQYDINAIKKGVNFSNFNDYKLNCENNRLGKGLKDGYVPSTSLWLIENEKFVGIYDIRHWLTDSLEKRGGHIAYYIIPSARNRGLAVQGLKLCCEYAYNVLNLKNVLVTCNSNNVASYKTMKKVMIEFGGNEANEIVFDDEKEKRIWIKTKPREKKIRPLAVAVIEKDKKILAVKGYDDIKKETFYRLIGGGIEFGEKGEDTIKREFMEEFGFEPINIAYFTTAENIFKFNGVDGHEIVLVYKADLPDKLKNQQRFYGKEDFLKDKYAEFVEPNNNKIYPEIEQLK